MNLLKILLIEDNPADARLVKESFNHFEIENEIYTTRDGFEAIKFLKNEAEYLDAPKPDIILLDLNLPKKDGREVLKEIKRSKYLKLIPVVILTISLDEEDILYSYKNNTNCYLTKPVDLDQFNGIINSIHDFWFTRVKLPSHI